MRHDSVILHRLLFAVRPKPPVNGRIDWLSVQLGGDARRISVQNQHVTLCIFDDDSAFSEARAAVACEAGDAVNAAPFDLVLGQLSGSLRSVALRPTRTNRPLMELQRELERQVRAVGLSLRGDYRFSPHLTLFYRDAPPFSRRIEPIRWHVDEFVLIHSLVGRTEHRVLGCWPLRGGPQYSLF